MDSNDTLWNETFSDSFICEETLDASIYDTIVDLSALKVESPMKQQLLLWLIVLVPMLLISVCLSCILGQLSDKFFCVPMIDKDNAKFNELNLVDAKGFKGFAAKLKALVKAISLSGIVITILISYGIISQYKPCSGHERTFTAIVLSWIACLFAYFFLWKIDFSYDVVQLNIFFKLFWFILSKVITLIIGLSFVRVVYLHENGMDADGNYTYCYCNNDDLLTANIFTVVYIAIFPVIWICIRLKVKKLICIPLSCICTKCCLCGSTWCPCELSVRDPATLPPPVRAVVKASKCCGEKMVKLFPKLVLAILFIMAPLVCLYIRFGIVAEKWNHYVQDKLALDITDIVFIWILIITLTFFMIEAVLRLKRKYCNCKNEKKKETDGEATLTKKMEKSLETKLNVDGKTENVDDQE